MGKQCSLRARIAGGADQLFRELPQRSSPRARGDGGRECLADLRSRAQRLLEPWPRRAPGRCLPSHAPIYGGRRRDGGRRCCNLDTLLGDDREAAEAFRCYEATRIPRVSEVQRISIENSWMRGPTDVDWFYRYDPCVAPLTRPKRTEIEKPAAVGGSPRITDSRRL